MNTTHGVRQLHEVIFHTKVAFFNNYTIFLSELFYSGKCLMVETVYEAKIDMSIQQQRNSKKEYQNDHMNLLRYLIRCEFII